MVAVDAFPCLTDAYDPVCLGIYLLQGSAPILNGMITLSIGGSHVVKLPVDIQLSAATAANELQVGDTFHIIVLK